MTAIEDRSTPPGDQPVDDGVGSVPQANRRFRSIKPRFEKAEQEYQAGRNWTQGKTQAGTQGGAGQDDLQEALQRTRLRAVRSAVATSRSYDGFEERGSKDAFSTRDTVYVSGFNAAAHQSKRDRQRRVRRRDNAEEGRGESEDGDENGEVAHLIAEQVGEIRNRMPSSSLMERIHSDASHFYDARQLMTEESADPVTAKDKTRWGMTGACEGSALVALAVFIEELARWEGAAAGKDVDAGPSSSSKQISAWNRLEELRHKETEKLRRHARRVRQQRKQDKPVPKTDSDRIAKKSTRMHETSIWAFDLDNE